MVMSIGPAGRGIGAVTGPLGPLGRVAGLVVAQGTLEPMVVVSVVVRGVEPVRSFQYRLRIRCFSGASEVASLVPFTGTFALAAKESRSFGRAEFPLLKISDSCTLAVIDSNGSPVSYSTTVSARTDGSVLIPRPGLITADGYAASPASADGQTVTVEVTYTGDLAIRQQVSGVVPGSNASFVTTVSCPGSGYSNDVTLADGQLQILTGIPAGTECRLSQPGSSAGTVRFEDNSGNPADATVTITGTRADCWDLRNASADCRASVVVTTAYDNRFTEPEQTTPDTPTTTTPDKQDSSPATTAAPAVTAAPAIAVEATPTFTG